VTVSEIFVLWCDQGSRHEKGWSYSVDLNWSGHTVMGIRDATSERNFGAGATSDSVLPSTPPVVAKAGEPTCISRQARISYRHSVSSKNVSLSSMYIS